MKATKKSVSTSQSSGHVVPPLDGGWGWMVVLGAGIMHFFLIGIGRSLGVFYIVLRERYHGSATETAWLLTLFNVVRTIIAPASGVLCDRFGCQRIALCGSIVLSGGLMASAFATSLFYLYFTFSLLAGIGGSMSFTAGYIIVSAYFLKKKGKAMALATVGSGLGHMIMSPAINWLVELYGFRGAMMILAALMLHNCISAGLYRPLRERRRPKTTEMETYGEPLSEKNQDDVNVMNHTEAAATDVGSPLVMKSEKEPEHSDTVMPVTTEPLVDTGQPVQTETALLAHQSKRHRRPLSRYVSLLCNPTFIFYGLLISSMAICIQGYLMFLPDYAMEEGAGEEAAAFMPSFMAFADMCGRLVFGVIFDLRFVRAHRPRIHAIFGVFFGLFTLLTGITSTYVAIAVVAVFVGLVESAVHSQRMTIAADIVQPSLMSAAVSLSIFFQGVGTFIGPTVSGILRDETGTSANGFFFVGSLMAFSSLLFLTYHIIAQRCKREKPIEVIVEKTT